MRLFLRNLWGLVNRRNKLSVLSVGKDLQNNVSALKGKWVIKKGWSNILVRLTSMSLVIGSSPDDF